MADDKPTPSQADLQAFGKMHGIGPFAKAALKTGACLTDQQVGAEIKHDLGGALGVLGRGSSDQKVGEAVRRDLGGSRGVVGKPCPSSKPGPH